MELELRASPFQAALNYLSHSARPRPWSFNAKWSRERWGSGGRGTGQARDFLYDNNMLVGWWRWSSREGIKKGDLLVPCPWRQ
jgi:hypothetical protein